MYVYIFVGLNPLKKISFSGLSFSVYACVQNAKFLGGKLKWVFGLLRANLLIENSPSIGYKGGKITQR